MKALLLHNARVVTMAPERPRAGAVAVRDGRIAAAGSEAEAAAALDADAERIDCRGGVLLPAFIDAHCHLLAYAASLRAVDCTAARSIAQIQRLIRERADVTPAGGWVRAFGYEETALAEGRHPTRRDLDAAAPEHPVRLVHRSGHASVLNSAALRRAGIDSATEEPAAGAIERELPSGEPSGLLLEMERRLDGVIPPPPFDELAAAVREASGALLRAGVTCAQDATATNSRKEWELFERLIVAGDLPLGIVMMEGSEHLGELPELGAGGALRRGPVKIAIAELGDEITPAEHELAKQVTAVHTAGRQVALHAVGERAVLAAAAALEAAQRVRPRDDCRHRIEHCSLLPEGVAARLARLGVTVVSQPAFVYERGDRYLRLVPEERRRALYAFRALLDAGVVLAAGSDAPVTRPEPLASVAAAVERRSATGGAVGVEQAVDVETALRWWTAGAARAAFLERERGAIRPGLRADLVLLPPDALDASPGELRSMAVEHVWHDGVLIA